MNRRDLLTALGGGALGITAPGLLPARAAERTIGWISPESREVTAPFFRAFQEGLRANATPGADPVRIVDRYVEGGPQAVAQAVSDLQRDGVALIVAQGAATVPVVRSNPSVPVVFGYSGDPVAAGIVPSLARPGGNATGMSFMSIELNLKRIDLLRAALPAVRRVALLSNGRHPGEEGEIEACQRAVENAGIELTVWRSRQPDDVQTVTGRALGSGAQALVMLPSSFMVRHAPMTCAQALARNVPVVSGWAAIAEAGALLTYGPNLHAAYRRVAWYVVRVLGGAAPASLPVERPTILELAINRRSAVMLNVTLPNSLLTQADEIYE